MLFDEVAAAVRGVPHMTRSQGQVLYEFIRETRPRRILELGFASGVSSCYLAAALDELGTDGHVLTIDRKNARDRSPTIDELLGKCGLTHRVTPIFADTSYTWELQRLLERDPVPAFDFVFIDGAHTWDVDGFAFLLADQMLRPGGWVLFDDLDWTLDSSPTLKNMTWVRQLPAEQRSTPQVRKVYELLVRQNPAYGAFRDENGWGWARKN
ncbi:O-methyltransferase [Actinopolymorpha alba]|uniref:O-methyltransferase n=1 Tax=Actinopolymorpha alba TaxID=533267 RepID=UPI00035E0CC0|nr:class I SAM-dependent methyltransferase [Actinopolymorpha alba]